MTVRLLLTRPEPDNARSAAALRALGHEVLCAPLLAAEPARNIGIPPGPFDAVAITSANAARSSSALSGRHAIRDVPLFAVGTRSADAARAAGFTDVRVCEGDVKRLATKLTAAFAGRAARCLYLAGEERAGDLAAMLEPHGIRVDTVVVYRMRARPDLPEDVRAALEAGDVDGVLHYSPRSASVFLTAARAAGQRAAAARARHFCLSPAVAAPLKEAGMTLLTVAEHPDEASLFRLLEG